MSAGPGVTLKPDKDLDKLAPKMKSAVEAGLTDCHDEGLDAVVYEALRSQELQEAYYARGRTEIPPERTVTNASSNLYSWHGFGLAVDVISRSEGWFNPDGKPELRLTKEMTVAERRRVSAQRRAYEARGEEWFEKVAVMMKRHGLKWGGDWKSRDTPHHQWGRCKPSPSDRARELLAEGGLRRVWEEVGAA